MEVAKFTDNLAKLLSKDVINDSDVLHFIKSLHQLSNELKVAGRFHTFGPIVKQWLRAYKPIFIGKQIDDSAKLSIRRSGKVMTHIFLELMKSFDRYEPDHMELYAHWRNIISAINARRLADYLCLYGQQFKSLIENLRTATNRCDQLSILAVLLLYIEQLSSDKLCELKENFNSYILDKLVDLNKHPKLLMNQHSFLHDIDAMGHCIISLKPTKIICDEIFFSINTSTHALWLDFNLRDNSITLIAVSPTQNAVTFLATLSRPKLIERLSVEHELKIRGSWSVINGPSGTFLKRTSISVYLPIHDRNAIWKAKVKSLFRFVTDTPTYSQSMSSQGNKSTVFDRRLAQFAVHGLDDRRYGMSQNDESFDSLSMSCSQFRSKSIAPIARKQLDADVNISVFGVDRTNRIRATKMCIENSSAIESKAEDDRPADLPIEQESVDLFIDQINESLQDTVDDPLDDDHLSDHSSGISFGNDVSVIDDSQLENEIDGSVKGFGASSQRSGFWSIDSSLSEIDKQVKRIVEGIESKSTQQTSQPPKRHTDENAAIAQLTDSIRNIIGIISTASNDRPNEEQTKSSVPNDSPLEKGNSLESQPVPPTGTEHAETDVANAIQMQDRSIATSASNLNLVKAYPSNDMLRNEKMDEPLADDIIMAGSNHDHDDNYRTDAAVNVQSNLALMSNESDAELEFDDDGMVSDKRGCIFVNSDEVEDALLVYMENNGLDYLKSRAFQAGNAERRQRSEREFRAIHKMIHRKFDDATYSPNHSFTLRDTAATKRKLWNNLDEASMCSSQSDSYYQQPIKKHKHSEVLLGNETNAGVANVIADREPIANNGKLHAVSCALTQLNGLIGYLKDFFETRKTCEMHRVQLLDLITKIQASNIMALNGEVPFLTTIANIRTMCQQAKDQVSTMITP